MKVLKDKNFTFIFMIKYTIIINDIDYRYQFERMEKDK